MLSGVGDRPRWQSTASRPRIICPASDKTCRIIRTLCSASPPTRRTSPDYRSAGIARIFKGIAQYRRERRGPMTSNVAECGGFLKTRPDLDVPDIQLHFCMAMVADHGRKPRWGTGFSCHVCLLRPKSRGSVWLQSADPHAAARDRSEFPGRGCRRRRHGRGLQDDKTAARCARAEGAANLRCVHRRRRERRRYSKSPAPACRHRLSPGRHLQDGRQRSDGGGRSEAEGLRPRKACASSMPRSCRP